MGLNLPNGDINGDRGGDYMGTVVVTYRGLNGDSEGNQVHVE